MAPDNRMQIMWGYIPAYMVCINKDIGIAFVGPFTECSVAEEFARQYNGLVIELLGWS